MEYEGRDLEAMTAARNYHQWVFDSVRPFLGRSIIEVGAGSGSFSELLLGTRPDELTLVEPSSEHAQNLAQRFEPQSATGRVRVLHGCLADYAATTAPKVESIVYVNVLEHILADVDEMRLASQLLAPGGRLVVFVPALMWLYGPLDRRIGHYRRYTRDELSSKLVTAGFNIEKIGYFDILGVLPWFVKYRVFRSTSISASSVGLYDAFVVPIGRYIERHVAVPFGKNLLAIGER